MLLSCLQEKTKPRALGSQLTGKQKLSTAPDLELFSVRREIGLKIRTVGYVQSYYVENEGSSLYRVSVKPLILKIRALKVVTGGYLSRYSQI